MIGLGSNRLTVCRRGGMSVTQAGRGGMEWLAGYRDPIWASPYSAQATAALKAQFPTQWTTIRDYGFAHPALVPFINEDPMLVCSLGLQSQGVDLPKRGIFRYGVAWFDLGLTLTDYPYELETEIYAENVSGGDWAYLNNANQSNWREGFELGYKNGDIYMWIAASTYWRPTTMQAQTWTKIKVTNSAANNRTLETGSNTYSNSTSLPASSWTLRVFPTLNRDDGNGITFVKATVQGTLMRHMIPFKKKDGDNVKNCLLDLSKVGVEGATLFYYNQGSGSFAISETPAS